MPFLWGDRRTRTIQSLEAGEESLQLRRAFTSLNFPDLDFPDRVARISRFDRQI
jgi:hypothetical protein